jgi:Uma2 family endonuclease
MATATAGSRRRTPASSGFVFYDVSWRDYEAMLRIVGDRPIRVTYDQGTMEIFMPSFGHDSDANSLGRMVEMLTEELDVDVEGGDTTTHKRKDLGKGAEPDKCYWFGDNARHMRGKRQLDLDRDPPPDLIIEVDVTRTSLDRLKIFAAMRVPEVWRSTGRSLQFLHLQADGTYQPRPASRYFPALTITAVAQFLKDGRTTDKPTWIRSFRAFVREKVAPGRGPNGR